MRFLTAAAFFSLLHIIESRPITPSLLPRADTSPDGLSFAERSRYDIIRSCILTIIACVWTSGHPNIAAPQDAGWKALKRRIVTMIYALIAPEAVVMWALRQNIAADRIANEYNRAFTTLEASTNKRSLWTYLIDCYNDIKKSTKEWFTGLSDDQVLRRADNPWTKTHGLFVQMGGFVLYSSDGRPIRVLSFKDFKNLRRAEVIDEPIVTERELKDRTKSDTLSKALAVLQTTWFVFQCAARWNASLPLTELEVITLGFAVLNAVIYAVWWNKPQGVDVAIAVPLKNDPLAPCEMAAESKEADDEHDELLSSDQSAHDCTSHSQEKLSCPKSDQDLTSLRPANVFYRCASFLLQPLRGMLSCRTIPPGALRVPDFYANDKGRQESGKACTIACIVGTGFGTLHALAWMSAFPSLAELYFWRLSTLIITAEPVFMLIVGLLYEPPPRRLLLSAQHVPQQQQQQSRRVSPSVKNLLRQVFIVLFALGTPLYIFARLTLIVLAFVSLRALPSDAFKVVSWTSFIPHL
ncbi:hypothetical protein D9619_000425 [Psilocybe cf. subviscida]|uniref:Uncharacterized protein n=1 Tax=Psilocybe cf. subviscida TaxID=2480587 RepID=A0A8H5BGE4_9AGAR|nr:hypothetical protein D9619_000425 [Psilocybe cf. subviscida]